MFVRVLAVNADGSNRHPSVNTIPSLTRKLNEYRADYAPDIFTISESRTSLGSLKGMTIVKDEFSKSDSIATAYDPKKYSFCRDDKGRVEHYLSNIGKYQGFILEDNKSRKICYTSVHLPHKRGKQVARDALVQFYEEKRKDVDDFIIAGDFNATPTELSDLFSELNLSFTTDDGATTKKGGFKDNILLSESITLVRKYIMPTQTFTHSPIKSTLELKKIK